MFIKIGKWSDNLNSVTLHKGNKTTTVYRYAYYSDIEWHYDSDARKLRLGWFISWRLERQRHKLCVNSYWEDKPNLPKMRLLK